LVAALSAAAWWFRDPLISILPATAQHWFKPMKPVPVPDPARYEVLKSEAERWRADYAERYRKARTTEERNAIEHEARAFLEQVLPAMMRCWLGTPWDFNGTAATPGGGKIACGYFVATVIKDAGFQVDRYQLAQQASGGIIHSFIPKDSCSLIVGKPYETFLSEVGTMEPGIYIVGLDSHVAFLVKSQNDIRFIHSSGSMPWRVVDENRDEAGALQRSQWRMLGNFTACPDAIRTWLNRKDVKVCRN
jgi:hypothetical protein